MSADIKPLVEQGLGRAPESVRRNLLSKTPFARARAEEAFAAMTVDTLAASGRSFIISTLGLKLVRLRCVAIAR